MYIKSSPDTYVRSDRAAFLLTCGTKDDLVPCKQSERMEKRLKAVGAKVRLLSLDGAGHNFSGDAEKEADAATIMYLDEIMGVKRVAKETASRLP
jgi:dipeptidyl aminopeptidase/acylaminoacyl peptidase